MHRKGFTTVELLVVIGVLMLLMGLVAIGLGVFSGDARGHSTRVMLKNLQGMLVGLEQSNRLEDFPVGAVPAPGDMSKEVVTDRYGFAVVQTQRVLRRLMTVPENRKAIQNFPSDQLTALIWSPNRIPYRVGDTVKLEANGQSYRCTQDHESSPGASPGRGRVWEKTNEHVAIPLDGFGNPIICVVKPNLGGEPKKPPLAQRYGLDFVMVGGALRKITSPPGLAYPDDSSDNPRDFVRVMQALGAYKVFFASAGRDGNFQKGDDNLYSFED